MKMDHISQKRALIPIQVSGPGRHGPKIPCWVGKPGPSLSFLQNIFSDNDRTVRRTDGTIIQNTISESFSSMVVTENSTNNVNQSFNDFINDQKYVKIADLIPFKW